MVPECHYGRHERTEEEGQAIPLPDAEDGSTTMAARRTGSKTDDMDRGAAANNGRGYG